MFSETRMHSEPIQNKSIVELAVHQQSQLVSIKEAAQRLRVSRSTAYRIDRINGPFRFVTSGRRIFIDLKSFDDYLGANTPSEAVPIPEPEKRQSHMDIEPARDDLKIQVPAPAQLPKVNLPPKSCGQRELILSGRERPFVIRDIA